MGVCVYSSVYIIATIEYNEDLVKEDPEYNRLQGQHG